MKYAIIYYSYSGNTRKVADTIKDSLTAGNQVDVIELKCLDESNTFIGQCKRAFKHTKGSIEPVNFDLSGYDCVFFGTPVWAFAPAPAMNSYLDQCAGIAGKEAVLFATYGSGTGKGRCVDHMQKMLSVKGAKGFKRFFIQQGQVGDKEFILSALNQSRKG